MVWFLEVEQGLVHFLRLRPGGRQQWCGEYLVHGWWDLELAAKECREEAHEPLCGGGERQSVLQGGGQVTPSSQAFEDDGVELSGKARGRARPKICCANP